MTETTQETGIGPVTVLHGHASHETAYLIPDYPYSWKLRCEMRVWVDGPPGKGAHKGEFRVMRQTADPKRSGPGRPGPFGQGEVSDGGHPWNAAKASTYADWVVLYREDTGPDAGHVKAHLGSFIYGIRPAAAARMVLDGTVAQLDDKQRKLYDLMAKIGRRHAGESWDRTVAWITLWVANHAADPSYEDFTAARTGWHADSYEWPVAVAQAAANSAA
jgi:hypothetical protein